MLLNACLTVQAHQANSHKEKGWERFTDAVIKTVSQRNSGVVFLLWGSYAQKKAAVVNKVGSNAVIQVSCTSLFITIRTLGLPFHLAYFLFSSMICICPYMLYSEIKLITTGFKSCLDGTVVSMCTHELLDPVHIPV